MSRAPALTSRAASTSGAPALLQRKCACGASASLSGTCEDCGRKKMLGLQTKALAIGSPHDALEYEADRIADQVMAGRSGAPRATALPSAQAAVQRADGKATGSSGVPAAVDTALSGVASPLDAATRAFFEPRFAHDFGRVRVRTDAAAANAVQARAFTVGERIVFGASEYQPGTAAGRHLLAHELAHVLQQGQGAALQRKVNVKDAKTPIPNPTGKGLVQTNAATIQGYLRTLCSDGSVTVDGTTGSVATGAGFCPDYLAAGLMGPPSPAAVDKAKEQTGCRCLCDMIGSPTAFTIVVNDADWPHTLGTTVTAPSPNSPNLWGAASVSGKALNIDPWLVLGHEFCGHAWLSERKMTDTNSTRGEGGHQETVSRENELRQEHGIEQRGGFKDPFCGESFSQLKDDGTGKTGPVQWSSYLLKCEAWRKKTYGGKYKISDKIP